MPSWVKKYRSPESRSVWNDTVGTCHNIIESYHRTGSHKIHDIHDKKLFFNETFSSASCLQYFYVVDFFSK